MWRPQIFFERQAFLSPIVFLIYIRNIRKLGCSISSHYRTSNLNLDTMAIDIMKQQPLLGEHRDIEANIMQIETTATSNGSSQPAIPDGINIGWLLKKDPRHYSRILDRRYKSRWQDKDYLATVWKHQEIRILVERCPSEFASVEDVRTWLQLLFDTRWMPPTPSVDGSDGEIRKVTRACWNGRDVHLMDCHDFRSMVKDAGRRIYSFSGNPDALAMDADLAASVSDSTPERKQSFGVNAPRRTQVSCTF